MFKYSIIYYYLVGTNIDKMKSKNQGLVAIFDLDGTLIDSGMKLKRDVVDAFGRFGIKINPSEVTGDWYGLAEKYGISKENFDREFDKRKSWEQALRDGDAPLFPDAYSCLDTLMENGVQLGILTRSVPEYTKKKITHFSLEKYIGERIVITSVDKKKFTTKEQEALDLMRKIGQENIQQAYFIGDNPEDVLVAPIINHKLGIATQGLYLNRYHESVPEEVRYYKVISSLNEVPEIILGGEYGR